MPTNLRELLTAAIDGELTPVERKTAERLLKESEAARLLYGQLKADAARLKNLPKVPAPPDLADNVMAAIRDRAMTPTPLPPSRKAAPKFNWSAMPIWVSFVTAAAVLIVISIGSYLYFTASERYYRDQEKNVAKAPVGNGASNSVAADTPVRDKPTIPSEKRDPRPEVIAMQPRLAPEVGPSPRDVTDIRTGPLPDSMPEIESPQIDRIRISHLVNLHELADDDAARKKLTAEIKKDELIRLDLFCRSTPNALDLVLGGLRARGVATFTDAFAQDQLKKKSPPELMIFTEAMTPDEVVQFLTALGADDQKGGAGGFDTLVAAPFLPADLTQLSKLLGLPGVTLKAPKGKSGVDIRKPLPEGTAAEVASMLAKMGSGSAPPPRSEKVAVVVAYSPMNSNPTTSREIKQFLDRRGDRKADAKPLMLVLKTIK